MTATGAPLRPWRPSSSPSSCAGCGRASCETAWQPGAQKALRLEGTITRLGEGSQAARALFGLYGAGKARARSDMTFRDVQTGQPVMVTADRRVAQMGIFGGDSKDRLRESFDDRARDLAKFLVRLDRGEAPRKE